MSFVAACARVSAPPRCRRAGVLGATVECNGRLRRGAVDGIDHRFEQSPPAQWQADAGTDYRLFSVQAAAEPENAQPRFVFSKVMVQVPL